MSTTIAQSASAVPSLRSHPANSTPLGATPLADGRCTFRVWAPYHKRPAIHLLSPRDRVIRLQSREHGYWEATADDVPCGARYLIRLDGRQERPDPASRLQPDGVHGPSAVVDPQFPWTDDAWRGIPLEKYVIYELHIGTFSAVGTFDGAVAHLDALVELGITAVEIMPIAEFPGTRNWGYDGVQLFAAEHSYGGPDGFRRLVDACHARGLAVVLDVVYNHLGPEGNYLGEFAPYFTSRYATPWGTAVNFDGPDSDEVREYFLQNARYWIADCHVDALRLDAIHAIYDFTARPFLAELAQAVTTRGAELGRLTYTIAESDLNDPRHVGRAEQGGYQLDAQWNDDLHHALHHLLTGETFRYYRDFLGIGKLAKAYAEGFVLDGQYSELRGRRHGVPATGIPAHRLVVFLQNHDQIGNRPLGDRLSLIVDLPRLKVGAAAYLLSPYLPMLFMGEEYGEQAPFLYFVDHSDKQLLQAVDEGRRREFAEFQWPGSDSMPSDEDTYRRCKLNHALRNESWHRELWMFYRDLLRLRREEPALAHLSKDDLEVIAVEQQRSIVLRRWLPSHDGTPDRQPEALVILCFSDNPGALQIPLDSGGWARRLDSSEPQYGGPGSQLPVQIDSPGQVRLEPLPWSAAVYTR